MIQMKHCSYRSAVEEADRQSDVGSGEVDASEGKDRCAQGANAAIPGDEGAGPRRTRRVGLTDPRSALDNDRVEDGQLLRHYWTTACQRCAIQASASFERTAHQAVGA
jgi:hypothetical protein